MAYSRYTKASARQAAKQARTTAKKVSSEIKQQANRYTKRAYNEMIDRKLAAKSVTKRVDNAIKKYRPVESIQKDLAQKGLSGEIKKALEKELKAAENRARMIARTETTRIENAARQDAFDDIATMGVMIGKRWDTIVDNVTRDWHKNINNEEQFQDDKFSNGGMYPGDPDLPAREVCNCRCKVTPIVLEISEMSREKRFDALKKIDKLTALILEELKT